jgi:hypothetical protein
MKTLELFSGTQSFSKGVKRLDSNNETITIDISNRYSPTYVLDILNFDYHQFEPGHFDIIWASPPCTEYSKAKTKGERNLQLADELVKKAFEIIDYLKPKTWILENVGTGLLVKRMEQIRPGLQSYIADYCVYGKPYRKRTIFWSNKELKLKTCLGQGKCQSMDGAKHIGSCGNGTKFYNQVGISSVCQKNSIPELLIDDILVGFESKHHVACTKNTHCPTGAELFL